MIQISPVSGYQANHCNHHLHPKHSGLTLCKQTVCTNPRSCSDFPNGFNQLQICGLKSLEPLDSAKFCIVTFARQAGFKAMTENTVIRPTLKNRRFSPICGPVNARSDAAPAAERCRQFVTLKPHGCYTMTIKPLHMSQQIFLCAP